MEQFRQIGEVLGGMRALLELQDGTLINQKQCRLIFDVYTLAFETIAEMIKQNLKIEDKDTKWKPLERPLEELLKIFKDSELYIQNCLEIKDWWGKAIILHQNKDCVEFHIHNLLSCFPVVIEALETASENSGSDEEATQKRRFMLTKKYDSAWDNQRLFWWKFGREYLVPQEICSRFDTAWKEDKWFLLDALRERSSRLNGFTKNEHRLGEFLLKKLGEWENKEKVNLLPSSVLLGAKDYLVKRRLDTGGSHCKEIHWLGENFALKTFFGDMKEPLNDEISLALSLSHPNILQYLCGFYDEEKKEGFLLMELMEKNLSTYIKENTGKRKRVPFTIPVAVDIMLQIARGMEHLHSRKIYHGELNPRNVLLKSRSSSSNDGYFHAKVEGFCLTSIKSSYRSTPSQNDTVPVIWYAPEVLAEEEQHSQHTHKRCSKYTEKADVYSFAMLCFELLTGKVPFEDDHLQGDKMVRNIRAGGRPLFPHTFPKYLVNLTRKCWQTNPFLRPSFSSICRILRYIKKMLIIDPAHGQPQRPPPLVDYCELEVGYSRKFPEDGSFDLAPVSKIPFQMFSYRLVEKSKLDGSGSKVKRSDSSGELFLLDDHLDMVDDLFPTSGDRRSVCSEIIESKVSFLTFPDQRSVSSEAPQRKTFLHDQFSNYPKSPLRKFSSSVLGETPESRLKRMQTLPKATADSRSICYEIPEEKTDAEASDGSSPNVLTKEEVKANPPLKKTNNGSQSSMVSENQEKKKLSLPITEVEQKPSPLTSEAECLQTPKSSSGSPHSPEKTENPETDSIRSDSSKIVEKKTVSATKVHPKIPEKKPKLTKIKDINTRTTGSPKQQSPSASPARSFKGSNSPSASPARSFGGYASARESPLNPCPRCYKTNTKKEDPLLSGLNRSKYHSMG